MNKQQSGFTLIELVVVLVLIAILAATAFPRFADLSDEANLASVQSIAGAIESASGINSAIDLVVEGGASTDTFQVVNACTLAVVNSLLTKSLVAADYTVTGAATIADKATETCTLTSSGFSADFVLIGTRI